jgi:hypothetical protein
MDAQPETIYWLTQEWADRLYIWRNGLAVFGALFLAAVGGLGYWGQLARDEFSRRATDPNRFTTREYREPGKLTVEIRPHGGQLYPFVLLVPNADRQKLLAVETGPPGMPPKVALVLGQTDVQSEGKYSGIQIEQSVNPANSGYAVFSSDPAEILYGQRDGPFRKLEPQPISRK